MSLLVLTLLSALAQDIDTFEVASVKPAAPQSDFRIAAGRRQGGPGTPDPGRISFTNMPLVGIVKVAFGATQNYQIVAPAWAENERFDLIATIPPGTDQDRFRRMLQNLLAERFGMKFHREDKIVAGYDLVIARKGSKLKETVEPDASSVNRVRSFRQSGSGRVGLAVKNHNAAGIVLVCQGRSGRPVVDKTGLTGSYDFELEFTTDPSAGAGADLDAPTVDFAGALESQLGLKLEPRKLPIDVVIIDHLDRTPTGN